MPLAVFCGNGRTQNVRRNNDGDHAVAQMTPVNTWGATFGMVQSTLRGTSARHDTFRVMTSDRFTTLNYGPNTVTIRPRYSAREFLLGVLNSMAITSNHPMQVVQIGHTIPVHLRSLYRNDGGDVGMNVVTPTAQYLKQYSITTHHDAGAYCSVPQTVQHHHTPRRRCVLLSTSNSTASPRTTMQVRTAQYLK